MRRTVGPGADRDDFFGVSGDACAAGPTSARPSASRAAAAFAPVISR